MTFEVRTHGNPLNLTGAVRGAVESIDKDLPLIEVRTQQQQIDAPSRRNEALLLEDAGHIFSVDV
jgi:hypothetical protein